MYQHTSNLFMRQRLEATGQWVAPFISRPTNYKRRIQTVHKESTYKVYSSSDQKRVLLSCTGHQHKDTSPK